jgi:hypothetical protein
MVSSAAAAASSSSGSDSSCQPTLQLMLEHGSGSSSSSLANAKQQPQPQQQLQQWQQYNSSDSTAAVLALSNTATSTTAMTAVGVAVAKPTYDAMSTSLTTAAKCTPAASSGTVHALETYKKIAATKDLLAAGGTLPEEPPRSAPAKNATPSDSPHVESNGSANGQSSSSSVQQSSSWPLSEGIDSSTAAATAPTATSASRGNLPLSGDAPGEIRIW